MLSNVRSKLIPAALGCIRKSLAIPGRLADALMGRTMTMYVPSAERLSEPETADLLRRAGHFLPNIPVRLLYNTPDPILTNNPSLRFGTRRSNARWGAQIFRNRYYVDWRIDPGDGAEWCRLANHGREAELARRCDMANRRFKAAVARLHNTNLSRTYVFGTGPSLDLARNREWGNGFRIVCNTIVRDRGLWQLLDPHFVTAGDTVYHFGANRHSAAFLTDLRLRLEESSHTLFLYPALFDGVVRRTLGHLDRQLLPIPTGGGANPVVNLATHYRLPALGNVLNLLLIPLACTLSRDVAFWGFDGRDPEARYFWRNSALHSYPEFMPELREMHPAFFSDAVPDDDPTRYIRTVLGSKLEMALTKAERRGYHFEMLHPSWTKPLAKRYRGSESVHDYFYRVCTTESMHLPPPGITSLAKHDNTRPEGQL
jgi:hypothetical protein